MTISKSKQKISQTPNVGSVAPTLRAKDSRAMKLGVPSRTLWSNDQDPVLLVFFGTPRNSYSRFADRGRSMQSIPRQHVESTSRFKVGAALVSWIQGRLSCARPTFFKDVQDPPEMCCVDGGHPGGVRNCAFCSTSASEGHEPGWPV